MTTPNAAFVGTHMMTAATVAASHGGTTSSSSSDHDAAIVALFLRLGARRPCLGSPHFVMSLDRLVDNAPCLGTSRADIEAIVKPHRRSGRSTLTLPEFVAVLRATGAKPMTHTEQLAAVAGSSHGPRQGSAASGGMRSTLASATPRRPPSAMAPLPMLFEGSSVAWEGDNEQGGALHSPALYSSRLTRTFSLDTPEARARRSPTTHYPPRPTAAPGVFDDREVMLQASSAAARLLEEIDAHQQRSSSAASGGRSLPTSSAHQPPPPRRPAGLSHTSRPHHPLVPRCARAIPERYRSDFVPSTQSPARRTVSPPRSASPADVAEDYGSRVARRPDSNDDVHHQPLRGAVDDPPSDSRRMLSPADDDGDALSPRRGAAAVYDMPPEDPRVTDVLGLDGEDLSLAVEVSQEEWLKSEAFRVHRRFHTLLLVQAMLRWRAVASVISWRPVAPYFQRLGRGYAARRLVQALADHRLALRPLLQEFKHAIAAIHPKRRMAPLPKPTDAASGDLLVALATPILLMPTSPSSRHSPRRPPQNAVSSSRRPRSTTASQNQPSPHPLLAKQQQQRPQMSSSSPSPSDSTYRLAGSLRPSEMNARREAAARRIQRFARIPIARHRVKHQAELVANLLGRCRFLDGVRVFQAMCRFATSQQRLDQQLRLRLRRRQLRLAQAVCRGYIARCRFRRLRRRLEQSQQLRCSFERLFGRLRRIVSHWKGMAPRRRLRSKQKQLELYNARRKAQEDRAIAAATIQHVMRRVIACSKVRHMRDTIEASIDLRQVHERKDKASRVIQGFFFQFSAKKTLRDRQTRLMNDTQERCRRDNITATACLVQQLLRMREETVGAMRQAASALILRRVVQLQAWARRRAAKASTARAVARRDGLVAQLETNDHVVCIQTAARVCFSTLFRVRPRLARRVVASAIDVAVGSAAPPCAPVASDGVTRTAAPRQPSASSSVPVKASSARELRTKNAAVAPPPAVTAARTASFRGSKSAAVVPPAASSQRVGGSSAKLASSARR